MLFFQYHYVNSKKQLHFLLFSIETNEKVVCNDTRAIDLNIF